MNPMSEDSDLPEWTDDQFRRAGVCDGAKLVRPAIGTLTNPSGLTPLDVRVLVRPDPVESKTAGGIFLPDQHKEREEFAQCKATLIAAGVNAWAEAAANPAFRTPEPGARVLIAKYGGIMVDGADGEKYRIMNDCDVTATIEER